MAEKKSWVWLLLLGGVGFYLFKQGSRIDVGSASVSELKLVGGGIRIRVKLPVLNRSDFTATIQGFLGQFFYGRNSLGNITLVNQIQLPARSSAEPEFQVVIGYASLLTELYPFFKKYLPIVGGDDTAPTVPVNWSDFSIKGTLYIDNVAVDLNQKVFE